MFALYPEDLGIILTYRCPSGCKHCLYNCGPGRSSEAMSPELLREALEAITLWPEPPMVHFTGGEPFLHFELLLEGTRIATELGIGCYLETSAAWCTDKDAAVERFAALREAGMDAVLISCSPFHAERIPPERTLHAIGAALETFMPQRTTVYISSFLRLIQRFDVERPTPLSRFEEMFGAEGARRILWDGYGIIPGGRAGYELGHLVRQRPAEAFQRLTCARELLYAQHSHFDLHGNYIPSFCGGLSVGGWRDLPHLLHDFQAGRYPPLINTLVEKGAYGLAKMAQREYGYRFRPEGYAGKCHLCVDVRRHLVERDDFKELKPSGFYDGF